MDHSAGPQYSHSPATDSQMGSRGRELERGGGGVRGFGRGAGRRVGVVAPFFAVRFGAVLCCAVLRCGVVAVVCCAVLCCVVRALLACRCVGEEGGREA
ncbi:hypothetical protein EYC84_007243 [Monilinia fructicola]|uniref:Uncharacterized protein n=1 Tax=Monilinia fructicola TaxID=38448 RepID=A0A5M9K8Q8_MONFR|nr:hypothetical protein EYC84_007243 [Monilinia fructicola]